jgi:hypothetical protein
VYDWADYLEVAKTLVAVVGGEGAERSAISRAYYAGYGKASEYAQSKGVDLTGRGNKHEMVWEWFRTAHGKSTIHAGIAQDGQRLKRWRVNADYRANFSGCTSTVPTALSTAESILANLSGLS